jgi:tRNA A-37 threonylcarbamoyl transferase component Bud32
VDGHQLIGDRLPPPGARAIKIEGRTVLWAQEVGNGLPAVLKFYRHRGPLAAFRGRYLRARVEKEFRALTHLHNHGLPCPEPMFWHRGFSHIHGFWEVLATRELRDVVSLTDLVHHGPSAAESVDFHGLFRMLRRMHGTGMFHGTMFVSNVLVGQESNPPSLYLTDAPRSILFPYSIVGTRMALYDLLDLCEVLLRAFGCFQALEAYRMDPVTADRFERVWEGYRPRKNRRQRLRGEFLLRRVLSPLVVHRGRAHSGGRGRGPTAVSDRQKEPPDTPHKVAVGSSPGRERR